MTDSSSPTTVSQPVAGPKVSRRKFLSGIAAIIITAAGGSLSVPEYRHLLAAGAAGRPEEGWLTLCSVAQLERGKPLGFPYRRKVRHGRLEALQTGIAYVVAADDRSIRVLANVCSHRGCRITWGPAQKQFVCPHHEGRYAVDGGVQSGPPPRPLEQFPYRVENGLVQIRLEV